MNPHPNPLPQAGEGAAAFELCDDRWRTLAIDHPGQMNCFRQKCRIRCNVARAIVTPVRLRRPKVAAHERIDFHRIHRQTHFERPRSAGNAGCGLGPALRRQHQTAQRAGQAQQRAIPKRFHAAPDICRGGGREPVAICDRFLQTSRPPRPPVRVQRARLSDVGKRTQIPAGSGGERLGRASVHTFARSPRSKQEARRSSR